MKNRIVLAYSGSLAGSVAIPWLAQTHDAEIVTLTLDLGQGTELDELRARALALGAVRAHVLDVREEFARDYVLPALEKGALDETDGNAMTRLAAPLFARKLAEIAAIESTDAVAHDADIGMTVDEQKEYARTHGIAVAGEPDPRRAKAPATAPEVPAHVEISFVKGLATSVNGISMRATELLESLTTIAAEHGIGSVEDLYTPAVAVLRAAYTDGHASQLTGEVRLKLFNGTCEVVGRTSRGAGDVGEGATFAQV
jgi:argininosuccinate synthase